MKSAQLTVGVDVSLGAARAVEWAVGEASRRGCGVRLVHIADTADENVCARVPGLSTDVVGSALLGICATMAGRLDPAVPVETTVRCGDPADELVAVSMNAQFLVVGANGAAGYGRSALGSVAGRVAVHARCPVVVVAARALVARPRLVVVGIEADGADSSEALRYARTASAVNDARLECVECTDHERGAASLLTASQSADLVVLGTQHTDERFAARLSSVAAGVLPFVECPVMLVGETP